MDWKNFDIDGWNCMVDRSDGTVLAFSDDGTKRIECSAFETKWLGINETLNNIIQGAKMEIACAVC